MSARSRLPTDEPHQDIIDHLQTLVLYDDITQQEAEKVYWAWVKRFPDKALELDLEQQGDNYIVENALE